MSIIHSLDTHFQRFQERKETADAALGLGNWIYALPHEKFESQTRALACEISQNLHQFQDPEAQEKVHRLFCEIVPNLETAEEKEAIYRTVAQNQALQNLLDPEVGRLRQEKSAQKALIHDPNHKLNRRIAKARLAFNMGYRGESAGTGMSGATFLRSITGKRLGLFKVSNEHQSTWKQLHDGVFRYVLMNQPYYLSPSIQSGVQAEEAAYIVSSAGGFGKLVPPTKMSEFGGIRGSFQLMAQQEKGQHLSEFNTIFERFEKRESYTNEEIEMFQEFAVYDYLIGNLDRHHRNWLVEYSEHEGETKLERVHAIDHDRTFVMRNPSSYLGLKSQYDWRELKIAKEALTDQGKQMILNNLQSDQIDRILQNIDQKVPNFMTPEMKARIHERAAVLRKMALSEGETPEKLGHIRTDREINAYLR